MRLRQDVAWNRAADQPGHLFASRTGALFGLNPAAASVLDALARGATPDQLVDELVRTFDVDRLQAEQDVSAFLGALREHGLVEA